MSVVLQKINITLNKTIAQVTSHKFQTIRSHFATT